MSPVQKAPPIEIQEEAALFEFRHVPSAEEQKLPLACPACDVTMTKVVSERDALITARADVEKERRSLADRGREVARLKGWIGNDPARAGELAEALNALTAHRLLGRGFTEAVADAQEAVTLAGRALAQAGPLGPYAPPTAAAALFAATVHLATIQSAAQLPCLLYTSDAADE